MMNSLSCTVSLSMPFDAMRNLKNVLYDGNTTRNQGIQSNPIGGQYGYFSSCTWYQQVSWETNLKYKASMVSTRDMSSCTEISSYARYQDPSPLTSACKVYLDEAGPLGGGALSQSSPRSSASSASPSLGGSSSFDSSDSILLSAGAIAGISIGGALLVLAGAIFFFWKRRRRYIKYKKTAMSAADASGLQVQELHIRTGRKAELGADEQRFEMETNRNTIEMPDMHSSPDRDRDAIYEAPDNSVSPVSPDLTDLNRDRPDGFLHLTHR